MFNYIIKRTVTSILTLWVIISVTFLLMHAIPGGPFDKERKLPEEIKANIEAKYNLDKPLLVQYADYMKDLTHLDLGPSFKYRGRTVNDIISYSFPASAELGAFAILFSVIVGLITGIISALKQGKWQDNASMIVATLGVTIPSFVLATLFVYVFALKLRWLPAMGWGKFKHMILPGIALGGYSMAFIARLVRSSLLDVVRQDFIRTARAKGLSEYIVIAKHALKNALVPVITYMGPLVAAVLTGSFVIEKIFSIPGLGREFITSISNRDYTTILGVTVFYSTLLIVCNLVVDIAYAFIDPRIKIDG